MLLHLGALQDEPDACTIELDLEEERLLRAKTGCYYQGGEGSCEVNLQLTNLSGRADKLSLAADMGMLASSQYSAAYAQPRPLGLPLSVELRVFRCAVELLSGCVVVELLVGCGYAFRLCTQSRTVQS
jgi:outer membrane protein insertion porin family